MKSKDWRTQTVFAQRSQDWEPHNLIKDELVKYSGFRVATEQEDFEGTDFWKEIPFDIKVIDRLPRNYDSFDDDLELFKWLLENQDLDRFHPTNRIIIMLHKNKNQLTEQDAKIIALYINQAFLSGNYYSNVPYFLRGNGYQTNHSRYGESHTMRFGLLIHYS